MLEKFNECSTEQAETKLLFTHIQTVKMSICSHCIPYKVTTYFNLWAPEFDAQGGMRQTTI